MAVDMACLMTKDLPENTGKRYVIYNNIQVKFLNFTALSRWAASKLTSDIHYILP